MGIDTIMSKIDSHCDKYAKDNYSAIMIEIA